MDCLSAQVGVENSAQALPASARTAGDASAARPNSFAEALDRAQVTFLPALPQLSSQRMEGREINCSLDNLAHETSLSVIFELNPSLVETPRHAAQSGSASREQPGPEEETPEGEATTLLALLSRLFVPVPTQLAGAIVAGPPAASHDEGAGTGPAVDTATSPPVEASTRDASPTSVSSINGCPETSDAIVGEARSASEQQLAGNSMPSVAVGRNLPGLVFSGESQIENAAGPALASGVHKEAVTDASPEERVEPVNASVTVPSPGDLARTDSGTRDVANQPKIQTAPSSDRPSADSVAEWLRTAHWSLAAEEAGAEGNPNPEGTRLRRISPEKLPLTLSPEVVVNQAPASSGLPTGNGARPERTHDQVESSPTCGLGESPTQSAAPSNGVEEAATRSEALAVEGGPAPAKQPEERVGQQGGTQSARPELTDNPAESAKPGAQEAAPPSGNRANQQGSASSPPNVAPVNSDRTGKRQDQNTEESPLPGQADHSNVTVKASNSERISRHVPIDPWNAQPAAQASTSPQSPVERASGRTGSPENSAQGVHSSGWSTYFGEVGRNREITHLIERLGHTEMRLDLRSEVFGAMALRTVVREGEVGAAIGVETSEARAILTTELPGLERALADRNLRLEHINIFQWTDGVGAGNGNQWGSHAGMWEQQRSGLVGPSAELKDEPADPSGTETDGWNDGSTRLSVHV